MFTMQAAHRSLHLIAGRHFRTLTFAALVPSLLLAVTLCSANPDSNGDCLGYFRDKFPSFIADLLKSPGIRFRTIDRNQIVLGNLNGSDKFIFYGKASLGEARIVQTESGRKRAIVFVDITTIEKQCGDIPVDGLERTLGLGIDHSAVICILPVIKEAAVLRLIAIRHPSLSAFDSYLSLVRIHELCHARASTPYLLLDGEVRSFVDEMLADLLLIRELSWRIDGLLQLELKHAETRPKYQGYQSMVRSDCSDGHQQHRNAISHFIRTVPLREQSSVAVGLANRILHGIPPSASLLDATTLVANLIDDTTRNLHYNAGEAAAKGSQLSDGLLWGR